jgi:hypothetical protein
MYFNASTVPVCQWRHREFDGVDPWANNEPIKWAVNVYAYVPTLYANGPVTEKRTVPPESNDVPPKFAVGIYAPAHNRYRILPNALQDLWRAGMVRDQDLARLLYEKEMGLRRSDYPNAWPPSLIALCAILFGIFAVIALGLWSLGPRTSRMRRFIDTAEWLSARPTNEASIILHGELPALAIYPLNTPISPPAGVKPGGPLPLLAVVSGGREKRLVLIAQRNDLASLTGLELQASSARLPVSVISSMKEKYQELNSDYVMCSGWDWPDAYSDVEKYQMYQALKEVGIGCVILALLCYAGRKLWDLRQRRLAYGFLALVGGSPSGAP